MTAKRALYFLIVVVVVAGGFFWAFRAPPVPVDLAEIGRGDVVVSVTDEGVARIKEVYTISAPVPGRVLRTPLDVGDLVEREETIVAVIEPQAPAFLDARLRGEAQAAARSAEAALALAEAEVARAEAELRFWRNELDRNERLSRTNTIASRTLEQTRLELSIREASLATAHAGLEVRRQDLSRARAVLIEPDVDEMEARAACCMSLRSPISGRVLEVIAESAHVVATGEPLIAVGDPTDLEIVVDLLSADAVRSPRGARARIERWGGDAALEARVTRIEPRGFTKVSALGIDEQRVNVILEIASPPEKWRALGHDYRVLASITIDERKDVLRAPMGAVFRSGDEWAAFVETEGVAVLRELELGARNDAFAEVLSGLEAGDRVVLHPSDRIEDGVAIQSRAAL